MSNSFSKRHGYKPEKEFQVEDIDNDLRNRIWNRVYDLIPKSDFYFERPVRYGPPEIIKLVWRDFFKLDLDDFSVGGLGDHIRWMKDKYVKLEWYELYDLLEFTVSILQDEEKGSFISECNIILEAENSAFRFIGHTISNIIDDRERSEIEGALNSSSDPVKIHMASALEHYSRRPHPDYRNSIKESISAVEAACKRITKSKATLSAALQMLEKNKTITIPKSLNEGFEKIYGYSSSSNGIRHGLTDVPQVSEEDARFMLVACSAFVNYLKAKAHKAGITV